MKAKSSFSSSTMKTKAFPLALVEDMEDEIEPSENPEYPDPVNCFREKHGCFGGNFLQIFWYREMGEEDFGIHMNAKEFERLYSKCDPKIIDLIFFDGILHEYFHHIVDSWCVRADVNRHKLMKNYEKEILKFRPIYMLEESMAEAFAYSFTKLPYRAKSGVYSLYESFSDDDLWLKGSVVVANQYLNGEYKVEKLTPNDGFEKKELSSFHIDYNWFKTIQFNSNFEEKSGFSKSLSSGVWEFRKIPLHIHNKNSGRDYHQLRKWFIDSFETRNERHRKASQSNPRVELMKE